jgi:hypothetical protein
MHFHALSFFQDSPSQMSPQQAQQFAGAFMGAYLVFMLIIFAVKVVLYVIPMWRICKRAGISPQLSLVCAIPIIGRLITTYIIAFSDWKPEPTAPLPLAYVPPSYPPAPPSYPPSQPPTV